ncbi:hypothetical protein V2V48_31915, partial [Pseudomonas aeruginosa]
AVCTLRFFASPICCHPFEDDSLNYPVVTVSKGGSTIICNSMPYIDVVFEEEMPSIPQVIVSSEFLFPFTPCAHGAMDAIDHRVSSLTKKGFRLYGGASPASTAVSSCGPEPASGRAVSLFSWMAIAKKL